MSHHNITSNHMKIFTRNLLILLFFTVSCNGKKPDKNTIIYTYDSFKEQQLLQAEVLNDSLTGAPNYIYDQDSVLLLIDNSSDYVLSLYNKKSGQPINGILQKGHANGEFIICWGLQHFDKETLVFDLAMAKLYTYDSNKLIDTIFPKQFQKSDFMNARPGYVLKMKNGSYCCSSNSREGELMTFFTPQGAIDTTTKIPYPFVPDKKLTRRLEKRVFEHRALYNLKNDKIVLYYSINDMFDIYNSNGSLHKRCIGPTDYKTPTDQVSGDNSGVPPEEVRFSFEGGSTTDNEIMLLYVGREVMSKGYGDKSKILVFDYDGNPLREYTLDRVISAFCVNEKEKTIYALEHGDTISMLKFTY